ncbi:MAG: glutamate-1-semialdehyde 2,1-aminomutase [bacterium]|nr:glutamate-1-semialdehyde 2,1-aminomutase [bacterium]
MKSLKIEKSITLFEEANKYLAGGVNSPVRSFKSVKGRPLFIKNALGSHIFDVDGNEYIDYVASWGPIILGHAHPEILREVKQVLKNGTSFGASTELEIDLAKKIVDIYPSIEMVRMTSSGTEATMSAIRLARGYTKKDKIIKFEGCYHGHADYFLVEAGSGIATLNIPGSAGVPDNVIKDTLILPFNDIIAVKEAVKEYNNEIAAVILEPVPGNMGVVLPKDGYLKDLREITKENDILLIFDEIITGLRLSLGGAQKVFNVIPDITCLGKIIGGGFPVGAYGGSIEIMESLAPLGPVYQAGTLSGNPIAVSAGIKTIELLSREGIYEELEEKSNMLERGLRQAAESCKVNYCINRIGSMLTIFFTKEEINDYQNAKKSNTILYSIYFKKMLKLGIYLAPSQFEAMFISLAHSKDDIEKTIEASYYAFKETIK